MKWQGHAAKDVAQPAARVWEWQEKAGGVRRLIDS